MTVMEWIVSIRRNHLPATWQQEWFDEFSRKHFLGLGIPERLWRVQQILAAAAAELRAATIISKETWENIVKAAQFG